MTPAPEARARRIVQVLSLPTSHSWYDGSDVPFVPELSPVIVPFDVPALGTGLF